MGDTNKGLQDLLKWGIQNSVPADGNAANGTAAPQDAGRGLNAEAIKALMGGPSDAELMQAAVAHATSTDPEVTLESKVTALDNLEQLIESLDNANLLSTLGLWTPLLELLAHENAQVRLMTAWVVGTAVQNNAPSQERLVALGGVEKLVTMALGERLADAEAKETKDVRRKAVYALSSACRNYQPGMDVLTSELAKKGQGQGDKVDATEMNAVDEVIDKLKEQAQNA